MIGICRRSTITVIHTVLRSLKICIHSFIIIIITIIIIMILIIIFIFVYLFVIIR